MKKTILTTLTAIALLTSCTKEDDNFQPVVEPTNPINSEYRYSECMDTCGIILDAHHDFTNPDTVVSTFVLATSCDILTVVISRTEQELIGNPITTNGEACFDRSKYKKILINKQINK